MSSRLFGGAGEFARFDSVPPVTAAPFTLLVAGQVSSLAALQFASIMAQKAVSTHSFRVGLSLTTGLGIFSAQQGAGSNTATTVNAVSLNTPFTLIGRAVAANNRSCILNGDIANQGTTTTNFVPLSIDRLSFGRKDDSGGTNPWQGVIFYGALWNAGLSDDEVIALGLNAASPLQIRPSALMSYWPIWGRSDGTTIIDVTGRCPLTLTGGSDSDIAMRRRLPGRLIIGRRAAVAVTGTVAIPATAPVTAAGSPSITGTAGISAAAPIAASGTQIHTGTAALVAAAPVAAFGLPVTVLTGTASLAAQGPVTATGTPVGSSSAAIVAAAPVSAAGSPGFKGTAAIVAVAPIVASGSPAAAGAVAVVAAATVAAQGTPRVTGSAGLMATAPIAAAGAPVVTGSVAVPAAAPVAASGRQAHIGTAAIIAAAPIISAGTPVVTGSVSIQAAATTSATGGQGQAGTVAIPAAAVVAAAGRTIVTGTVGIVATPRVAAVGTAGGAEQEFGPELMHSPLIANLGVMMGH